MNVNTPIPTVYGYFNEKYGAEWIAAIEKLKSTFQDDVEEILMPQTHTVDIPTLFVRKAKSLEILQFVKDELGFGFLTDYTATDEEVEPRFHLVLHLMSLSTKARLRIKIRLGSQETMPTLVNHWNGANWAEREIYDMFGIIFDGHPDLRRILMDMRWEGHPLRKDYPLKGYQLFLTPELLDPELLK